MNGPPQKLGSFEPIKASGIRFPPPDFSSQEEKAMNESTIIIFFSDVFLFIFQLYSCHSFVS